MKNWTDQSGYPLIQVDRNPDGTIQLTQVRIKTILKNSIPHENKMSLLKCYLYSRHHILI
jgi:aminopeptidase N